MTVRQMPSRVGISAKAPCSPGPQAGFSFALSHLPTRAPPNPCLRTVCREGREACGPLATPLVWVKDGGEEAGQLPERKGEAAGLVGPKLGCAAQECQRWD